MSSLATTKTERVVRQVLMITDLILFGRLSLTLKVNWLDGIFVLFTAVCLALFVCAWIPWYTKAYRGLGIEEHFGKLAGFASYLAFAICLSRLAGLTPLWVTLSLIGLPLAAFGLYVNFALIGHHRKDKDTQPPSFFAAGLYQKNP
jgi:hypothetical protein